MRQTTFALDHLGAAQSAVFIEWIIENKSSNFLQETYASVWCDPDLGVSGDDLVGCDPVSALGYCYNATSDDGIYGASPPAVGLMLLQGPIVPSSGDEAYVSGEIVPGYRNLPMTAFSKYINGIDPSDISETYYYMQGLTADGSDVIDPTSGEATIYAVPGDPVAGTGWIDSNPADRRTMLSAGPFTMSSGDVQVVVAAVVVGQGQDRLASVTELRAIASEAPNLLRAAIERQSGARCESGEGCVVTSAAECFGDFFPGQPCPPDPCAPGGCQEFGPISACCLPEGGCEMVGESECIELGGSYLADAVCELRPPGGESGWRHNDTGGIMIDEVAGSGGVPIPPDGQGGPGNAVWHSRNSTFDWLLSAGGGDGGEGRFTRSGADLPNLSDRDVILRFDDDPGNVGVWTFDNGEVGDLPFGLYERDPTSGDETRLIAFLFSADGTAGVFDYAPPVTDPFTGSPATDWIFAWRFDGEYAAFLADVADGSLDNDPTTVELFARLIVVDRALPNQLPAEGTEIQFSTLKSGTLAGSGFDSKVPLAWPEAEGKAGCFEPEYLVYRDSQLITSTERTDFLDQSGLVNDHDYVYQIAVRNPENGHLSALSRPVEATARADGYRIRSAPTSVAPTLDGFVGESECAPAAVTDASANATDLRSTLRLMSRSSNLYIALEDAESAHVFRIYIDSNHDGVFQPELTEGVVVLDHGAKRSERLQGVYPKVSVVEVINNPPWMDGAWNDTDAELRLSLSDGPLGNAPAIRVSGIFFWSPAGLGVYPPGPPAVLREAPRLYALFPLRARQAPVEAGEKWESAKWAMRITVEGSEADRAGTQSWIVGEIPVTATRDGLGAEESESPARKTLTFADPALRSAYVEAADEAADEASTDFRAARGEGQTWNLSLSSRPTGAAELRFEVLKDLGPGVGAWLVDPERFELVELRETSRYSLEPQAGSDRELLLVVGAKAFLDDQLAQFGSMLFEVSTARSFPNPFARGTSIAYRVRETDLVSVTVYDVTGAVVRRISPEQRRGPGVHVVAWDGRDASGRDLPSGMYFYRVAGERFRVTRPLTILR